MVSYTATNLVRVTLDDLAQIGKIIDIATQAGADESSGFVSRSAISERSRRRHCGKRRSTRRVKRRLWRQRWESSSDPCCRSSKPVRRFR